MESKAITDFGIKFNKLNSDNQRYIIAIQQALAYAQSYANETEKVEKEKVVDRVS